MGYRFPRWNERSPGVIVVAVMIIERGLDSGAYFLPCCSDIQSIDEPRFPSFLSDVGAEGVQPSYFTSSNDDG